MSLLPNDLASGSTAVIPMLTEAGPTQPFFAPASGGGGGGGPVLSLSTINMNPDAQINMRNAGSGGQAGFNGAILAFDKDPVPNVTVWMGYNTINDAIQITQESGAGYASAALQVDAILCSSINGAAPGGGVPTNLEVSTLRVSQGAPNTGIRMKYSDGTSSFGIVANDGTVFNQIKPSLVYGNNFGNVVSLGADIVAGGLGLTGTGGSLTSQTAGYISGDGAGNVGISSLNVSSINSASPGGLAVGGITKFSTIQASSIGLQGFSVPLFQNGRLTMPNAPSTVIETDIVFSDTTWGAWAGYDGAVNSAVSSIGTEVLSRSTFALFAQGGLGVSWQVLGN